MHEPALSLHVARGCFGRLLGVHAMPLNSSHEGLIIAPCSAVHTLGLSVPIDLVFLDGDRLVIQCVHSLPPNRWAGVWGARAVVELPGGYCSRHADWLQQLQGAWPHGGAADARP
jgi:hypothetical protein